MTVQEAIETIKYAGAFNREDSPLTVALDMAEESLEKQIPITVIGLRKLYGAWDVAGCPRCNGILHGRPDYCGKCGQKLNWG
jgi:hypothetical protein